MTRNGPKIVTLKYGSNFIASDVTNTPGFEKLNTALSDLTLSPYSGALLVRGAHPSQIRSAAAAVFYFAKSR